jgi:hypothetical protein
MNAADRIIADLVNRGAKLWTEGERLRLSAPPDTLTPEIKTQLQQGKGEILDRFHRANATCFAPVSSAQRRLWFLQQLDPSSSAYHFCTGVRLHGHLDVERLRACFDRILHRHQGLRARFLTLAGQPVQAIAVPEPLNLSIADLGDSEIPEQELQHLSAKAARQRFDLASDPLLRATLVRLGPAESALLLVAHHLVTDGWSMGVLLPEVAALYDNPSASLPELPLQYPDFAIWQQQWLQGEQRAIQLDYWRGQLGDCPAILPLPGDRPRPAVQTNRGARYEFTVPAATADALDRLSQQEGATSFVTLLAAFKTLLYRYCDRDDIPVGSPIANRHRLELEGLIGFFVNTLVLRTDLSGNPSFRELLGRVRAVALDAYAHPDLPFDDLVDALDLERSLSHNPLFQVAFAFQNAPLGEMALPGLTLEPFKPETGTAKFDLTLTMQPRQSGLSGEFEYNRDLFDADTIARMARHFQTLLAGIAADPDRRLSELPLLSAAERHQLLEGGNSETAYRECSPHDAERP